MILKALVFIASVAIAVNIGVCVWAVLNNAPHHFAASGCIAAVLAVNIANAMDRRKKA